MRRKYFLVSSFDDFSLELKAGLGSRYYQNYKYFKEMF